MTDTKLIVIEPERATVEVERDDTYVDPNAPVVGQWYWYEWEDRENGKNRDLVCVTRIGSNYAKVAYVEGGGTDRIHLDKFPGCCTHEPHAEDYIRGMTEEKREEVADLMEKVHKVTALLGVAPRQQLTEGGETQALARITGDERPIEEYKTALIKAKDETLPELFEQIEDANEAMAQWMSAGLIPLKAEAAALKPVIKKIEQRIFNVELYAGLTEEVVQVRDGDPALDTEKIHLFQRRHYMDEECLANYRTGGMGFDGLEDFDDWVAEPENLARLLPFPRCLVAFKVRRHQKEREFTSFSQFVEFFFSGIDELEKKTFLYMRNGDQVFRLCTGIEFDEKLFPDLDTAQLEGKLYCKMFGGSGRVEGIITEADYLTRKAKYDAEQAEYEAKIAANEKLPKAERKNLFSERPWGDDPGFYFTAFNDESTYFDEMREHIQDQMDTHNRVVLVLQGLLDRSPIFHPHPPWQLWSPEGFGSALKLIFDQDKALTSGDKPDFEAYRAGLHKKLKKGSITMGQERVWTTREHEKDYNRNAWRSRSRGEYHPSTPYGNPGPGRVAEVQRFSKAGATYKWMRERQSSPYDQLPCKIRVAADELFNISAYKPGDFKQFFDDPRTRAEYLRWAPFLLEAEEYHAGNVKDLDRGFRMGCRHTSKSKSGGSNWKCSNCDYVLSDEESAAIDEDHKPRSFLKDK